VMPLAKARSHVLAAGPFTSWSDRTPRRVVGGLPAGHHLARSSKSLARSDKSSRRPEATKERERLSALVSALGDSYENPRCVSPAGCDCECDLRQCR